MAGYYMCGLELIIIFGVIALVLNYVQKKEPSMSSEETMHKQPPSTGNVIRVDDIVLPKSTMPSGLGVAAALADKADEHYDEDRAKSKSGNGFNIVCIADGLGQTHTERSDLAAEIAVESVVEAINLQIESAYSESNMPDIDKQMEKFLDKAFLLTAKMLGKKLSSSNPQAKTTLLVGVETVNWMYVAYIGDGGIWYATGNINDLAMFSFPHHDEFGSLTRYLKPGAVVGKITFLPIRKSLDQGEILLLGSDGIFESEDKERGSQVVYAILTQLKAIHQESANGLTTELIEDAFKRFIHNPSYKKYTYPDNQSLAIIITKPALEHWDKKDDALTSKNNKKQKGDLPDENQGKKV